MTSRSRSCVPSLVPPSVPPSAPSRTSPSAPPRRRGAIQLTQLTQLFAASVAMFITASLQAAIITVYQNGSGDHTTIQAAIDTANSGDTILIGPGSYDEFLNTGGKTLTLRGVNGYVQTIVDPGGDNGTLLTVPSGTGLKIEDISFRNGRNASMVSLAEGVGITFTLCRFLGGIAGEGAAVLAGACTATFVDCQFTSNVASSRGGAVKADGATLLFDGCTFTTNQCTGSEGGALRLAGCTSTIVDCTFNDNRTTNGGTSLGGAIFASGGSGDWSDSTFTGNDVDSSGTTQGGDLYLTGSIAPEITNVVFSASRATNGNAYGGSILLTGTASPVITGCTFDDCQAATNGNAFGGAIFMNASCNPRILSSTFNACRVPNGAGADRGGAIWIEDATPLIDGCTFTNCQSNDEGGAIFCQSLASPTILSCTFTGNTASRGGALWTSGQSSPLVAGCVFASGAAGGGGGGVYAEDSAPAFASCLFQENGNSAMVVAGSAGYFPLVASTTFCGNSGDISGSWYDDGGNVFVGLCGDDCNGNGISDAYEIDAGLEADCNDNGVPDGCELAANPGLDCNGNGTLDGCEGGGGSDCDGDGVIDECEDDCNKNGTPDDCEILAGSGTDCDGDGVLDSCQIAADPSIDCDGNGLPDSCDVDCDGDGVPDECEIDADPGLDCDGNGVLDACELAGGDINNNAVLDACEVLDLVSIEVEIEPIVGVSRTANSALPLSAICYRIYAVLADPNAQLVAVYGSPSDGPLVLTSDGGFFNDGLGGNTASARPCDPDGNFPSLAYDSFLTVGGDCSANSVEENIGLDFSGFNNGGSLVDNDGIILITPGDAQGYAGASGRVLIAQLTSKDGSLPQGQFNLAGVNTDGSDWLAYDIEWGAASLVDCNGNGEQDARDIGLGLSNDCNLDGVPDECQTSNPDVDCNANGTPDWCDISSGTSSDADGNGVPDECECTGDLDGDGVVDVYDVLEVILSWGEPGGDGDANGDGIVDALDLSLVIASFGSCL